MHNNSKRNTFVKIFNMNREIKFRGKRVDSGGWVFGFLVIDPKGNYRIYFKPFSEATSNTFFLVEPNTVGQFTGLYDKNNTPIFESDIVKHFDHAEIIREVIFMKGSFGYWTGDEFISYASNYHFEWKDLYKSEKIEVIGSIHSNPEIIK